MVVMVYFKNNNEMVLNNMFSLFDLFVIDIETVPEVGNYTMLPAEARKLFFDKISKTMPENFKEEKHIITGLEYWQSLVKWYVFQQAFSTAIRPTEFV